MRIIFFIFCLLFFHQLESQSFEKGLDYYNAKDFSKAIDEWKNFSMQNKENETVFYNLANAYYELGEFPEAIYYFNKCLKINPQFKDARYNLTIAKSSAGIDEINLPGFQLRDKIESLLSAWPSSYFLLAYVLISISGIYIWKRIKSFNPLSLKLIFSLAFASLALAGLQEYYKNSTDELILMKSSALYLSPDNISEKKVELRAGEKLLLLDKIKNWSKVKTATFEIGWVEENNYRKL